MDAFKAHFTDDVAAAIIIGHTGVVKAPAGHTSKVQPLDVCINKPFKSVLSECWKNYVVKVVKGVGDEENNDISFKPRSETRKNIANWVPQGHVFLQESKAMIQWSFEVCGINTTNCGLAMVTF